jgi:acyl-CoA reductase-like NAD-dependent aldehyde dehydrogenase
LVQTYESYYQRQAEVDKVGKIVNNAHWKRLTALLASTKGNIILGGNGDEMQRFIEPTVITNVHEDDPIVQGEIFGPLFPVLKYRTTADALRLQRKLSPTPLAVYVFSENLEQANDLTAGSMAGTASINDCMAQIAPTSLPFGGFGNSGHGAYRGRATIETFSHKQSFVNVPTAPEFEALLGWRYPYAESMQTVEFVKANLEAKL